MDELISLGSKLAGAGFATLLFIILVGSRLRIWRWQQDFVDLESQHVKDLEREVRECRRLEEERDWWRAQCMTGLGIAETQATVLRVKASKEHRKSESSDD